MRILVTGAGGQLGRELTRADWGPEVEVLGLGSSELDIANASQVLDVVARERPQVIVNAAAYTKVDQAESESERATAVNGTAVGYLAEAADGVDALLVHISTDYVFDGTSSGWYSEQAPTCPESVYGRSKLLGEQLAVAATKSVVLRTAWVYGALGSSFVSTILRLIAERDELRIVADQHGCPTSAQDLAQAIVKLAEWSEFGSKALPSKIYHAASPVDASWHSFAEAVIANSRSGFSGRCLPISTEEYPTPAKRPANSRLDTALLRDELGIVLPAWSQSLPAVVAELQQRTRRSES